MHPSILLSGTSHPEFAKELAHYLKLPLGKALFQPFPDGELYVQILENVRGRDVFVVQSIALRPNDFLMELLIMIDALKRASAASITAVIPYFGYARQDRKDKPRVPITAKLVADLFEAAGATRILTMDLHAGQIQGFFNMPVDNLYARPLLGEAIGKLKLKDLVIMAPDLGAIKTARAYADQLEGEFVVLDKRRLTTEKVEVTAMIGDVKDRDVVIVDDMCSTGGTLIKAAETCCEAGANRVFAAFTHPVLVAGAAERLNKSPIEKIYTTNTVPLPQDKQYEKIEVVSVAGLFGKAIQSIISADSISSIFN